MVAAGAEDRTGAATSRAYLLLTFTSICFGANTTFAKLLVGEASPMVVVALRWLLVVLLLAAFNTKALVRDWPHLKPRLGFLFAMGALGFASFNALFYIAAHHTTAVNMGIIQGMMPALVLAGAWLAYRTPARKLQWVGAAVTLAGVAVVASAGEAERLLRLRFNTGDLLVVLAVVLYAGYTVGLRRRPESTALGLFTVLAASAFLASLPMVAAEAWLGEFQAPTLQGWVVIALVALLPSFLAQVLFIIAVEIIGPGRAGIFVNLVPVFAAIIAVAYLGEDFHLHHGLALALVLGGIWLAERGVGDSTSTQRGR
ncbi:MAG: DMT family transporter [Gammaproteobacteria bacterium]|nr:DMT family transporter [Gammaproteobacteria bacterium]